MPEVNGLPLARTHVQDRQLGRVPFVGHEIIDRGLGEVADEIDQLTRAHALIAEHEHLARHERLAEAFDLALAEPRDLHPAHLAPTQGTIGRISIWDLSMLWRMRITSPPTRYIYDASYRQGSLARQQPEHGVSPLLRRAATLYQDALLHTSHAVRRPAACVPLRGDAPGRTACTQMPPAAISAARPSVIVSIAPLGRRVVHILPGCADAGRRGGYRAEHPAGPGEQPTHGLARAQECAEHMGDASASRGCQRWCPGPSGPKRTLEERRIGQTNALFKPRTTLVSP